MQSKTVDKAEYAVGSSYPVIDKLVDQMSVEYPLRLTNLDFFKTLQNKTAAAETLKWNDQCQRGYPQQLQYYVKISSQPPFLYILLGNWCI